MRRWLLGCALLLLPAGAIAQADAPAIWTAQGAKGKVTLFGSFHLLPSDVAWRTPAFGAALEEAEVIVFETDLAAARDPARMEPLLAKHGMLQGGQTLQGVLPPATYAELEKAAAPLGLPASALAPMRPWLAALVVGVQFLRSQGYDPAKGVEQEIAAWAQDKGRRVDALESVEAQLRVFADLAPPQEAALLAATLKQIRDTPRLLARMLAAYRRGDTGTLARLLNASMAESPDLYRRLMRERHEAWLPQLERMLADGRPHVVIVGAGHLAGADSVVAMLRARGVRLSGP